MLQHYKFLLSMTNNPEHKKMLQQEIEALQAIHLIGFEQNKNKHIHEIYQHNDIKLFHSFKLSDGIAITALQTLDKLLEHDKQREKDGFPRKIRIGKLIKPKKNNKDQVIVVPTTTEPKFYHDLSTTEEDEETTGGSGEGEEGEVIGKQKAKPEQGEGEGTGAGQGEGNEHDITSEAFDLGKILTEKFDLPNIKDKGKKYSLTKYTYDLTDKNKGFGQVLDKKDTLKRIVETNIQLGNISEQEETIDTTNLLINPQDQIYRILSREKDFESQAVVFFMRDYSGSMQGKPTELVCTQHLLIYSWLMYQFQNRVISRFVVHDTEAKEVPDFYSYYKYQVAGGTNVAPGFELINQIVTNEQLAKDYNIYVFYGTDGDDWDTNGEKLIPAIKQMLVYCNRLGITVAKSAWTGSSGESNVEKNINNSGLLKEKRKYIRIDAIDSENYNENRIIEGIKILVG